MQYTKIIGIMPDGNNTNYDLIITLNWDDSSSHSYLFINVRGAYTNVRAFDKYEIIGDTIQAYDLTTGEMTIFSHFNNVLDRTEAIL